MKGHVRNRGTKDKPNWAFVIDLGRDADTGRRKQKWKSGYPTKTAANVAMREALSRVDTGTYVEPTKVSLAVFLRDEWLPSIQRRKSTVESYRHAVEAWIIPALGARPIRNLTPAEIQAFFVSLRGADRRDGRGVIGDRTVQYIAIVLKAALGHATNLGLIQRNPAAAVERPRATRPEMKYWDAAQAGAFLESVADDRLYAGWLLLLSRGLRRGELLGLRWADVDLDAGRIAITQTLIAVGYETMTSEPKTAKSRRSIPLDPTLVEALRRHRRRQAEERLAWGEAWANSGLVFTREDGTAIHPQAMSREFLRLSKGSGQPRIRFHDLRHTAATLALQAGIAVKVVSEWLGHASTTITSDIYQHVTPAMAEEAGALVTGLLVSGAKDA